MKKNNLIFDIDDTLIKTIKVNENEINDNYVIKFNNFFGNVFLRPHLEKFFNFCYLNFNVGFWTAGSPIYCKEILKLILTEDQFNETIMIFARDNNDYIDLKTNKFYKNIINDKIVKPLDIVWNDKILGKILNQKNTLLIDDNTDILNMNKDNYLLVSEFKGIVDGDNFLCYLTNLLDEVKNYDDIRKISEIKNITFNCNKMNNYL